MKTTVISLLAAVLAAFYFPFPAGGAARIMMPVLADGSGVVTEIPQDRDELETAPQKDAETEVPQDRNELETAPQEDAETEVPQERDELGTVEAPDPEDPEEEKKPRFDIRDYLIHRVF